MANGQTNIAGGKPLSGTAQPSDVRMGMTYPDGKELRSGTLDLTNLLPENIRSGVTVGGVAGVFKDIPTASLYDNLEGDPEKRMLKGDKVGYLRCMNYDNRNFFRTFMKGKISVRVYYNQLIYHFQI
ncbi:MAG: hypothetical protein Q4A41_06405, partial [Bacillota bacterium]|nr:hypothetical protein [Bacillota bacterium]